MPACENRIHIIIINTSAFIFLALIASKVVGNCKQFPLLVTHPCDHLATFNMKLHLITGHISTCRPMQLKPAEKSQPLKTIER